MSSHFVYDDTELPYPKAEKKPVPNGQNNKHLSASEWNDTAQALVDVKTLLRGAKLYGLTPQAERPAVDGVDSFVWVNEDGELTLTIDGEDQALGATGPEFGIQTGVEASTLKLKSADIGFVAAKDPVHGATGLGIADDRAALQSAINSAASLNADVFLGEGTFLVGRAPGLNHSLIFDGATKVGLRGVKGKTWIKHAANAATGAGSCQIIRISNCERVKIRDVGIDGNWGNALTEVSEFSDLANLSALDDDTLFVKDTSDFPSSGEFTLVTKDGAQVLTYSGKTSSSFTGVSAGTGVVQKYDKIGLLDKRQKTTTIAAGSDGATLPQGTIHVASTTGFPTSAGAGKVRIFTSNGYEEITYSGKTSNTLTGCAGGTGTMSTGGGVEYVDGAGNQATPMQVDPKNHGVFVYGSDGNVETPNRDIVLEDVEFKDIYGDFVWTGAWSSGVKLVRCRGTSSARNGLTISNYADGISMQGCRFENVYTSAVDSEPVDGPTAHVTIDDCDLGIWFNPYVSTANICMSVQGGTVGRPAAWNYCQNWRVTKSRFAGTVLISDAKNVVFDQNEIALDYASTGWGPLVVEMFCQDVWLTKNHLWSRAAGSQLTAKGLINVVRYQTNVNTAAQPGNIFVAQNVCAPRNGLMGIYVECTGGYGGYSGTATGYTPPSSPSNYGQIEVSGTPWAAQTDYWAGHQVVMDGKIANVVGNDSNTLLIAPLRENYADELAWHDARGRAVTDATAGAFTILPLGGIVKLDRNEVDCTDSDGAGAGAEGIVIDTDSTWDEGFNHQRVQLLHNNVRGATGPGIRISTFNDEVKWKSLHCIGNHVWDDQPTTTCTAAILWENPDGIEQKTIYGNTKDDNVPTLHSGLTSGSWRTAGDYPEEWAGYEDPNGLITAPPTSTYRRLNSNVIYLKESPADSDTGWVPLKGATRVGIRDIGIEHSGAGALDMTGKMPASVDGDIEILIINSNKSPGPGTDATLSTPARFLKKVSALSNYAADTIHNRTAIWWRRKQPGDVAPVIADAGDFNEAIVVAFKDCIGYGDPFDFAPVSTTNTAVGMAVTATGGTTVTDGALFCVALGWFVGGLTKTVSDWANSDGDLTEESEVLDRGVTVGSDRISIALFVGRTETAAAIGDTTATIDAESYALWSAVAFGLRPAQVPARATGTITCTTKANYVDTDYMGIGDGIVPAKRYDFDTAGDGDGDGIAVNISGATSAADVAAILRTAILANQPSLGVTDNADGTLTVTHNWPGAGGNVTMTGNVGHAGHTVSGLSGGQG